MRECDYCGEYKKVRFVEDNISPFDSSFNFKYGKYICKECDKAKKIKIEIENKKYLERKEKEKKDWIKKRDKLLKENKK